MIDLASLAPDEFLLRLAASAHVGEFVLRGGLMTQLWVGREKRATRDIDLVGLFPCDMVEAATRIASLLSIGPQTRVAFGLETLRAEAIWQETSFPGLRFLVEARDCNRVEVGIQLQIDVGFGDPLVPPAEWIDYPTPSGSARLQVVRPELLVAWKLDGLFDLGPRRWQAKDLYDLHLLTSHCILDQVALTEGITVAFEAHDDSLTDVLDVVYSRAWWESDAAQLKWAKFRATSAMPVPADLVEVASGVARKLRPALERLIHFPRDRTWLGEEADRAGGAPPPPSSA